MVAPSSVHPLPFFGRAPRGTTNTDLCKELVKRFAQTECARAVQDFGAGRFGIVFRTIHYPRGTTNTDLCKELVKRFAQTDLRAVQDFGAGRFEIVFRTKAMVDRFLADPVLKETEIKFEYRGVWTKIVRVLGYPTQDAEQALIRELGAYGKVLGVQHESEGFRAGSQRNSPCSHGDGLSHAQPFEG
ncbi:hypothetical protein HPB50_019145 [Hyalomma asiaticum]|uniref:Uncharacterized protein n=1 Tax=Hyalomma asiaticum TaxID=266040 RepID=A0ACB7RVH3_HYAAI|nr:hypothetical protein HPB50_019145 [Hyalomma asiaticum]